MDIPSKIKFKDLKAQVARAIKESCYRTDARLYNVANQVNSITTYALDAGNETVEGLTKIVDKTIKESVALDCDLSVIVKGILLGSFRSNPSIPEQSREIIHILIKEILQPVYKYKGDIKEAIEGILAATVILAGEYKFDQKKNLDIVRENISAVSKALDPVFADEINKFLPQSDDPS
jgi:hypothetical protein